MAEENLISMKNKLLKTCAIARSEFSLSFKAILYLVFLIALLPLNSQSQKSINEIGQGQTKYDTWIGAQFATVSSGVAIADIFPSAPAEKAGLAKWDKVISIDGRPIANVNDVENVIQHLAPGSIVPVEFTRDGIKRASKIRVDAKEDVTGFLQKKMPISIITGRSNKKDFRVILEEKKIKIIYFWFFGFEPSEKIKNMLGDEVKKIRDPNLQMVTVASFDPNASAAIISQEKPYQSVADDNHTASLIFRVHQYPALIIADENNIIRFAAYVDDRTLIKSIEMIQMLRQKSVKQKK